MSKRVIRVRVVIRLSFLLATSGNLAFDGSQ